jgi:heavy metal translocating P-type ATPase
MLLEVGIMFTAYWGIRVYEKYRQTTNKPSKSRLIDSFKSSQIAAVRRQKNAIVNQAEKQHQHYYKMSVISMGLSAIRQFFYPHLGLFSLCLFIYTAFPQIREVEKSLTTERKVTVDVLFLMGDSITLALNQYFAAAFSMFLFHRGRNTLAKAKGYSEKMLFNVFEQQPRNVWLLKDNIEAETPLETVKVNDILVVNTGEVIPVDGIVVEGIATIDQHALTGESQPIEKSIGDQVFAATIIITGKIYLKVEKSGEDTTIAKIAQILNNSINVKSNIQLKGEKWANKASLPMLGMAGLIFPILGPVNTVVFINSHIGYRIRLFAPLGTLNHISLASHKGILIKDGRALESLMQVDTILFDKTGTLTHEQPEVGHIMVCGTYKEEDILTYAAAAERKFTHPIAKAIVQKAEAMHLMLPDLEDSNYKMGYGITVVIENQLIRVGSGRFMLREGLTIPDAINEAQAYSHSEGYSFVLVAINHQVGGAIEIRPQLRPEVKNLISGLRQRGIKHLAIVSGDHQQPTQKLAQEIGMDSYFYDILPENKAQIVEQLQAEGKSVCFVGDGINDAIAMKKANVSISLRGATSIATDMAEIVLMDGSLSHLCDLIDISKALELNLQRALMITFIPTIINLSGAFFLHFGILTSLLMVGGFNTIGYANTMLPLKKIQNEPSYKD